MRQLLILFIASMLVVMIGEANAQPAIEVDPMSIDTELNSGETEDHDITIRNSGDDYLNFSIQVEITSEPGEGGGRLNPRRMGFDRLNVSPGPQRADVSPDLMIIPDEQVLTAVKNGTANNQELAVWNRYLEDLERIGSTPSRDQRGDPDNFGYIWRDDEEDLVVYDWIDITETGERLQNVTDDWSSGSIDMGWTFEFYGQDFNSIRICSNGFVSFTSNSTRYTPFRLPRQANPINLLAAQWFDLNPAQGGEIYYYTDQDEQIFIVSWIDIPRYAAGDNTRQTFQLILNGEGVIKYQYADDNAPGSNNCIGIQNRDGRDGLSIYWGNGDAGPDGRAYEIMRSWVEVDPVDDRVRPGNQTVVTLTLDATYLIEGTYESDVHILSDDPDDPDVVVDVVMFVHGEPDILPLWDNDLGYPDIIDWNDGSVFPDIFANVPYEVEITMRNTGTAVLNIADISTNHEYFTVDQDAITINPRHKTVLTVTFEAEEDGDYDAILTLSSDDPDESEIEIDLHAETSEPPIADFEPLNILKKLEIGDWTEETITVRNHGDESPLRFSAEVEIVSEPGRDGGERAPRRAGRGIHSNSPGPHRYFVDPGAINVPDEAIQAAVKTGTASAAQEEIWNNYLEALERFDNMPSRDAHGGLDDYGYVWRDEEEGLVDYEWIDITGIGTRLRNVTDDWNSGPMNMNWTFNFYGQDFSAIRVCSNGFVSFTSASRSYTPFPVPKESEPYNLIAPQWADLNPTENGDIYFYTDGDQELTIVSWIEVELYHGDASTRQTFQLILNGNNEIKLQYADDNLTGTSSCIGIQNSDGSDGLLIHYGSEDGGPAGKAYGITRSWVRLDPVSDEVDPGGLLELAVTLDAAGLIEGDYEANLIFDTNDPENDEVIVNVQLRVGEGPGISISPDEVYDFGDTYTGEMGHLTCFITNIGFGDLEIERITVDDAAFSHNRAGNDNFIIEPDETRNLIINFQPDDAQDFSGELIIYSDDPQHPETTIQLTGRGINRPPDIYLGYQPGEEPDIDFTEHTIAGSFDGANCLYTTDLDQDGDVDVLGAALDGDDLMWWENNGSQQFSAHIIAGNFDGAAAVYAIDLDQDGDNDVLGAARDAGDITWWENDGSEHFTSHTIAGGAAGAASVHAADFDGDGDVDVVGAGQNHDEIRWWENDGYEEFTEHIIVDDFDGAGAVYTEDIDGDGDFDILGAAQTDGEIAWWENNGDKSFTKHTIAGDFTGAVSVFAKDVDGDGDMDVLGAAQDADDVTWWENDGDESFTEHTIAGDFDGAVSVYAKDVDGDGDIDVLAAAEDADDLTWWENDGDESFTEHTIAGDFNGAAFVFAHDVDDDFDMDVLGAASVADDITWWENAHEFGYDFGEVEKDSTDQWTFVILNHGAQILTVTGINSTNGVFTTDFSNPINIDPGASAQVEVYFTPDDYQTFGGTLEITSNDPDEGTVVVQLSGDGIFVNYPPEVENPIADLELDEDFDPYILANLDAVFSDPNEDVLTYIVLSDRDEVAVDIVNGSELRIDSDDNWYGDAQITVTADDGYDGGGPSPRRDRENDGPIRQLRRIDGQSVNNGFETASNSNLSSNRYRFNNDRQARGLRSINDAMLAGRGIDSDNTPRRDDTTDMVFNVQISAVNDAPVWDDVPVSEEVNEDQLLSFTVEASDVDGDDLTLDASGDLPGGWNFTDNHDGTATFTWTPGYDDSGDWTLTVTVSDAEFDVDEDISITVNHVNRTPIWDNVPESEVVDEAEELSFTVEASDPDGDDLTIEASSVDLPGGWNFTDNNDGTGTFTWTPGYDDSGDYTLTVTVSDAEFDVDEDVAISVNHVNRTPVWDNVPESENVNETEELSFTVEASDPDGDDLTLEASSVDLPGGWNFTDNGDGTGTFTWTPGYDDSGDYTLTVTVSDAEFDVDEDISITVNHVNRIPVWDNVPESENVNEDEELSFTVEASDPDGDDLTLDASSVDLPGGWNFTDNDDGTGTFTWTPGYDDSGDYTLTVTVSDAEFDVDEDISITVNHINRTPVWDDVPESADIDENQQLTFTVVASDPDNDALTLTASSDDLPGGWTFTDLGNNRGTFRWTPTFDESGEYSITFTASDAEFGVDEGSEITVNHVNRTPVWDDIPQSENVNEDELLEFTMEASDPDGDDLTIEYFSDDLPEEVNFTDNDDGTAQFSWRPGFGEAGSYTAVFTLSDTEFDIVEEVIISVGDVNRPPSWDDVPESEQVSEGARLEFSVVGSDPDGDDVTIEYSSGDIPEAAEFTDNDDGSGTFTWTPSFDDAGDYTATFTISDAEFGVAVNVPVTVNHVNRTPAWDDVPESEVVDEAGELSFTVEASDPDGDDLTLDASSADLPAGWNFTDNGDGTGLFTWTPGYDDSGNYTLTVTVSDAEFDVDEDVSITVNHVNRTPVWDNVPESENVNEAEELSFSVEASDPDGDDLTLDASSADLPVGWDFTDNGDGNGVFVWTPGYDDAGEYALTVTVSDAEYNVDAEVTITVNHVNRTPVWDDIPESETIDEADELLFTVTASDPDGDDLTINAASNNLPEGWSFIDNDDGTGTFTWTPAYEDAGEYTLTLTVSDAEYDVAEDVSIIVGDVNRTPVWDVIPVSESVEENQELSFTVEASDPDGDDLTISASSEDLPEGWNFTDNGDGTGTFTWTPGYEDEGEYSAQFTVTDDEFEVMEDVTITVGHVNRTPVWDNVPEIVQVNENQEITFTVEGSDPDGDDLTIQYSSGDIPEEAEFTDNGDGTGSFTWTPTYNDAGDYTATFTISDAEFDVETDVAVTIYDVNRTPVWDSIPESREIDEAAELSFTVAASDPDGDDLTIEATSNDLPDGWNFTDHSDGTGSFVWTPTYDDAGEYTLTLTVSDEEFDVVEDVTISVNHVNRTPVWDSIPESREIDEAAELSFTVETSDPDDDDLTLGSSSDDLPEGWSFTDNGNGTGDFNWTPTYDDAGEYSLVFTVSDGEFEIGANVTILVNHVNRAPAWDDVPESREINEGRRLEFTVQASDPDDDDLDLDASSDDLPDGWEFSGNRSGRGTFRWTPTYNDAGEYTLTVTVSDGEYEAAEDISITVIHVNRAPVWDNVNKNVNVDETELLTFIVEASDPDGDDFTLTASSGDLPDGWEFTDNQDGTGTFNWRPGCRDAGVYNLTVTVSDAEFDVDEEIEITVNRVNCPPRWIDLPVDPDVNETEELIFNVEGSDPDFDDLTLEVSSVDMPDGWQFTDNGDATGSFAWTPGYDDSGEYSLTLTVSDGEFEDSEVVTITVNHVNRTPVWDDVPESEQGSEGASLTFTVQASDPDGDDLTTRASSDDLPDGWTFTDRGDGRGSFRWTPGYEDAGDYLLTVTVSDSEFEVVEDVTITVVDVNRTPVWDDIPNSRSVSEDELLEFTVEGSDPDGDDLTIVYTSDDLPDAVQFNDNGDGTAVFSWRPAFDAAGAYTAVFTLSDGDIEVEEDVIITVGEVNRPPNWDDVPASVETDENQELVFTVSGSDPDGDDLTVEYSSEDIPEAAEFSDNGDGSGTFTWTPNYDDAGEYTATFTISDDEFSVEADVAVIVNNVNRPPQWDNAPESVAVDEAEPLEFTVEGSDPDGDDLTIEASSENLPDGWEFLGNGHGTFSWTPGYDDAGEYNVTFTLSDGVLTVETTVIITVNDVNRLPVWDNVPESERGSEGASLTFSVQASDPDGDDLEMDASSDDLPDGWEFVDNGDGSGSFNWTPDYDDAGDWSLVLRVSDGRGDTQAVVTITVNNVNREPVWDNIAKSHDVNEAEELSFTVEGRDPDVEDDVSLRCLSDNLPEGWRFTDHGDGTGTFRWTPDYNDAGEYRADFTISDGEFDVIEDVTITVNNTNRAPYWVDVPENAAGDEGNELRINVRSIDPDGDDITLQASSDDIPDGWEFRDNGDGSGRFEWTPGYEDAGQYGLTVMVSDGEFEVEEVIELTINQVNLPPMWIDAPESERVSEGARLEFNVRGSDPDNDDLILEASSDDLPEGWQFTDHGDDRGTFRWTPDFDAAGEYNVTFTVTDGEYEVQADLVIIVNHVNRAPVWDDVPQTVHGHEGELMEYAVAGFDPDIGDDLTIEYSSDDLPDAVEFTDNGDGSGLFTWTPGRNDTGAYLAVFTLSDGEFEVIEDVVIITVGDVNQPPTWDDIPESERVSEGARLEFSVEGSDPEGDDLILSYSSEDIPEEAAQFTDNGDGTGVFTWTPTYDDEGEYTATFTISDEEFDNSTNVLISVINVNRQPVWDYVPESERVNEGARLEFSVEGNDPDNDDLMVVYSSDDIPNQAEFTDNGDGSGTFIWETDYTDAGQYSAVFALSDGDLSVETEVVITVNNINRHPQFVNLPEQHSVVEQGGVVIVVMAVDPDVGDELTLKASSDDLPDGWQFTDNGGGNGIFDWTPGYDDAGQYRLTITVSDGEVDVADEVIITVNNVNRSPAWVGDIPEYIEGDEGNLLEFTVEGSDPDNDDLIITITSDNLPDGWSFTDNGDGTGEFSWMPGQDDTGLYSATFTLSDGDVDVVWEVVIGIGDYNHPPVWIDVPETVEVDENEILEFTVSTADPENDDLTIEASSGDLPDGWIFTDNEDRTATFNWTPTYDDAGEYTLTVTVSDGEYNLQADIVVVVNNVNRMPLWDNLPYSVHVEEDELLRFTVEGSDPDGDDLTMDAFSEDIPEGCQFTDNGDGSGYFSWRPGDGDTGTYTAAFTVSDYEFDVVEDVIVTVGDVNRPPCWDDCPHSVEIDEGEQLELIVRGSDPNGDDLTISYSSENLPEVGAEFIDNGDGTGVLSWSPGYEDADEYSAAFVISDGEYDIDATVEITVNDVNRAPVVVNPIDDIEIEEDSGEIEVADLDEVFEDPEGDSLNFRIVTGIDDLNLHINPATNILTLEPTPDYYGNSEVVVEADDGQEARQMMIRANFEEPDGQQDGQYRLQRTSNLVHSDKVVNRAIPRRDGTGNDEFTVHVSPINDSPLILNEQYYPQEDTIDVQVDEGLMFILMLFAEDVEDEGSNLNWQMVDEGDLPEGWYFTDNHDGSAGLVWQPDFDAAREYPYVTVFRVTDSEGGEDELTVNITARNVNRAPVWDSPDPDVVISGHFGEELAFNVGGHDPDSDRVSFEISDRGGLPMDVELHNNGNGTARFIWQTTFDDAGEYNPTFTISDGNLSDDVELTIVIECYNRQPEVVNPIDDVELDEDSGEMRVVDLDDVFEDPDGDELTFSVYQGIEELNLRIDDETHILTLEPAPNYYGVSEVVIEADDGNAPDRILIQTLRKYEARIPNIGYNVSDFVYRASDLYEDIPVELRCEFAVEDIFMVTVNPVNDLPVLSEIGSQEVDEGAELLLRLSSTDVDGRDILTYSVTNPPTGAMLVGSWFIWEPDFDQAGEHEVTFIVTDNGAPRLSDEETVIITVGNINQPPVLDHIGNVAVDEEEELIINISAEDPDGDNLVFSCVDSLPDGAEFEDREFLWIPGEAGNYQVTFRVTDDGDPERFDEESIVISVGDVNQPPVLAEISDRAVEVDEELVIILSADDPDGDDLTFSADNLPEGAEFDGARFSWTPDEEADFRVTFRVTDNGEPELSDEETVTITAFVGNHPPEVAQPIDDIEIDEDSGELEVADLDDVFEDPDGDWLSFRIIEGIDELNLHIDRITHILTLEPAPDYNGESDVVIEADDGQDAARISIAARFGQLNDCNLDSYLDYRGIRMTQHGNDPEPRRDLTVEDDFLVTVNPVNDAPVWEEYPEETIEAGVREEIRFDLVAGDVDEDDDLTIEIAERGGLPDAAELEDNGDDAAVFNWMTTLDDEGEYTPVFSVSDGEVTVELELTIIVHNVMEQSIHFNEGWNMISINVTPGRNYYDEREDGGPDVRRMIERLVNDDGEQLLIIMKDQEGDFCAPEWRYYGIRFWDLQQAYYFKVSAAWDARWVGVPIAADTPVDIQAGWGLIPYYPTYELPADWASDFYAFTSIVDDVERIKNGYGEFMSPEYGFSDMRPCAPGMGFQVYAYRDVTLQYPEPYDQAALLTVGRKLESHWKTPASTGENMSVLITAFEGLDVADGDQVAAFSSSGELVGVGTINNQQACGLAVWGDDSYTDEIDGLRKGERFTLRIWDADRKADVSLTPTIYHRSSSLAYMKDGFIVLDLAAERAVPVEFELSQNYPNPFNSTTLLTFTLPQSAEVKLTVCDMTGRLVDVIVSEQLSAGRHSYSWIAHDQSTGVYVFTLEANGTKLQTRGALIR